MQLPGTLISLLSLLLSQAHSIPTSESFQHPQLPQAVLADTIPGAENDFKIPTRYESTVLGRRMLAKSRTGFLNTIFPSNITSPYVPHSVASTPIGLPEYIASCEEPSGNPTIIALKVSTSTRNALAGSNASLALSWWDEYVKITHHQPWSTANLPRLSLVGFLEEISSADVKKSGIVECFTKAHKDSRPWLPGNKNSVHEGLWMRLVVEQVYWIGGFGDRAFIGWFDPEEWHNVSVSEWKGVRLPGED